MNGSSKGQHPVAFYHDNIINSYEEHSIPIGAIDEF